MNKEFLVDFLNKINIKSWYVKDESFLDIDINKENLAKTILNNFARGYLDLLFINTKYKGMSFNGYGPFKLDEFCEWTNQPLAFDVRNAKNDYEGCLECSISTSIKNGTEAYSYMLDLIPFLEFDEDVAGDGDESWDSYCSYKDLREILEKINLNDYFLVLYVYDSRVFDEIK